MDNPKDTMKSWDTISRLSKIWHESLILVLRCLEMNQVILMTEAIPEATMMDDQIDQIQETILVWEK